MGHYAARENGVVRTLLRFRTESCAKWDALTLLSNETKDLDGLQNFTYVLILRLFRGKAGLWDKGIKLN